jgi:hypothetical protein
MQQEISRRSFLKSSAGSGILSAIGGKLFAAEASRPVQLRDQRTVLDIAVDGKAFATYNYNSSVAGLYRPFFHPIMGPNDRPITQNGEFPGTLRGHYWHRGLFVAHQKVNGISFWEEREADCGRIVHLGFDKLESGFSAECIEQLAWRDLKGRDILHETRKMVFPANNQSARFMRLIFRLRAVHDDVTFDKTPYNLLACRVINSMCRVQEKQKYARDWGNLVDFSPLHEGGRITNSEGQVDDVCRGARARWCDFSGPLGDGTWGGIALMDHPDNPRHPTPWHNWNNMTITASFTYHEPFSLREGQELHLAYMIYVHAGNAEEAEIEKWWRMFSQQSRN